MADSNQSWEQQTIANILEMGIKEQRAKRRWGIFFKLVILAYLLAATFYLFGYKTKLNVTGKEFTAVVGIYGEIADDKDASADNLIPLFKKAFENPSAKAVMMRINSPGGSPVQTSEIFTEIKHIRSKHPEKKLYAVIEDAGASAAYWLACAADEIYADESSIVGSIGVLMSSFGFVDVMKKYGVERRLLTAGDNKGMMDPFSPLKPQWQAMMQKDLDLLHGVFIDLVKQARGDRLKVDNETFSGRFWIGLQAKEVGLIDGFGTPYTVARDIIGAPELVEYEVRQSLLSQIKGNIPGGSLKQALGDLQNGTLG